MRLFQFIDTDGKRAVGVSADDASPRRLNSIATTRELALEAHGRAMRLEELVSEIGLGANLDYSRIIAEKRILVPLDHPDPAHCLVSVTGLTHMGSAESRHAMHAQLQAKDQSDSMRMFKLGLDGGKPLPGKVGAQPEWAYKGDGAWIVQPEQDVALPSYADDIGEEAELVGLYVISDRSEVLRVGFALGNEFSDHVMERKNYLYLAHSKLRQCSFGPEARIGALPTSIEGKVSIRRGESDIWQASFLTGESEMCHSISNLEFHHFKYRHFRRPGDVHVHFLGASVLSFGKCQIHTGDVTQMCAPGFGAPLRNTIKSDSHISEVQVKHL